MKNVIVVMIPRPWNLWPADFGPILCIKEIRTLLPRFGLKEAKEFIADARPTEFTPDEWKQIRLLLDKSKATYSVDGKVAALCKGPDPLDWLLHVGGALQTSQGPTAPGGKKPRRMFNVAIYPVDGPGVWVGPRKKSPRLAIQRAAEKWAEFNKARQAR